ncbi:MAG TPA: cytochrome c, partial [Methylomirabilota bacterium]|nr:cytochrome c [Methylomirabilota bacterium]
MKKGLTIAALLTVATVGLARAQQQTAKSKTDPYAELRRVPEKARDRANPLSDDPEAPIAGEKLFERHCMECHGRGALGTRKGPSLRATEVQEATPGTLFWLMTNGVVRHRMPVWSKLPEPQRWQIVSYLKSLGPASGARAEAQASNS